MNRLLSIAPQDLEALIKPGRWKYEKRFKGIRFLREESERQHAIALYKQLKSEGKMK